METEWMERGNCRNLPPETFFPADEETAREVATICRGCYVKDPCLQYAIDNNLIYGIWGGTSEKERRRMLGEHTGLLRRIFKAS